MSEQDRRPVESQTDAAGVDVTLIDEMLRLSPKERLQQNDRMAALAIRLKEAFDVREGRDGWKRPAS